MSMIQNCWWFYMIHLTMSHCNMTAYRVTNGTCDSILPKVIKLLYPFPHHASNMHHHTSCIITLPLINNVFICDNSVSADQNIKELGILCTGLQWDLHYQSIIFIIMAQEVLYVYHRLSLSIHLAMPDLVYI